MTVEKKIWSFTRCLGLCSLHFSLSLHLQSSLSTSKAFLSADRGESSAKLEPSKQIKIFNISRAPLDKTQIISAYHITMLMGSLISFLPSGRTVIPRGRLVVQSITNVVVIKIQGAQLIQLPIWVSAVMLNFHFLFSIDILTSSGRPDGPFQGMLLLPYS